MAAATRQRNRGRSRRGAGGTAWYVYGVVPADVQIEPGDAGVGDPPGRMSVVRQDDLAALVSEVKLGEPLGRPDDLMAHQRILDAAAAEMPVLPMRFGAVVESRDAVAEELLAAHHDEFSAALADLEGRAEYIVKGRYEQAALLKEVLSANAEAAEIAKIIRGQDRDGSRNLRIRLGEIISTAVTAMREQDTKTVTEALARYCEASSLREPGHEEEAVHVGFLARRRRQGDLEQAVRKLAREWEGRVHLRLLGPLAPYDFVGAATGG